MLINFNKSLYFFFELIMVPILFTAALSGRLIKLLANKPKDFKKIVWGHEPIINLKYWSSAMSQRRVFSQTWVTKPYSINKESDFDIILDRNIPLSLSRWFWIMSFLVSDINILCTNFNGFLLGGTNLWRLEPFLYHLSGTKIIIIPYGGDAHVYRNHRSIAAQHALQLSYPRAARYQKDTLKRIDFWCEQADAILPGLMGPNGIGRWDAFAVSVLHIDTSHWKPSTFNFDGSSNKKLVISHFPNHRGVKGTEQIIKAVNNLTSQGFEIELDLIEGTANDELLERIRDNTDIVIESLTGPGHGLTAIEAMALGKVVINNLDDDYFFEPFRNYSFFAECPIVSATPSNIEVVLKMLIERSDLRSKLAITGRQYVEKYHSYESAFVLFNSLFNFVLGTAESTINIFDPILGYYRNSPRVNNPLVKNRIP